MRTVYIHTTPDGKKYVGATHMNPEYRFNKGRGYKYQFFYQAILQFGWENISHQLYEVDTEEELKYLEKYLIAYYDTTNPDKGYNITKGDATQDVGRDHPEYGKSGSYSQNKEIRRKYATSVKGKESRHKYNHSDKGRAADKRGHMTEKGKAADKRYRTSEKGKEVHNRANKRWLETEKGKETYKLARQRWLETEKGKEARRRAMKRWYEKKKKQTQNE